MAPARRLRPDGLGVQKYVGKASPSGTRGPEKSALITRWLAVRPQYQTSTKVEVNDFLETALPGSGSQEGTGHRVASKNRRNCSCAPVAQGHSWGPVCSKASGHCECPCATGAQEQF